MAKYSAYFLKGKKGVDEQYFEGKDVTDALAQAKDYAKDTKQTFSSLWELQRLSAAGRPIVTKEAKGRLDQRGPGEKGEYGSHGKSEYGEHGKSTYGDHGKSAYKSHGNYKSHKGGYTK